MQDPDAIVRFVQSRIPHFESLEHASSLSGGMTNQVWRVSDGKRSVILKYAPPFVSLDPDTPWTTEESSLKSMRSASFVKTLS